VDLVTQFNYPFIPKAFLYPQEAAKWKRYLKDTPGADRFVWVRKNAGHRGVVVTSPREAEKYVREDAKADIFIQRFVYPPHLIEGRKWDIGVYVLVTSLEPLRVYYYDDILVRFCKVRCIAYSCSCACSFAFSFCFLTRLQEAWPEQLSAEQVDTYVIADDYTSPWDFAPFQRYRDSSTKNVKQWMDRYFAAMQPTLDWPAHLQQHTANAIRRVVRQDREAMAAACQDFPDKTRQFFEIYRFDFVFDDKLNPFLMEANMSPNLSPSAHPHLSKMFEKILIDTAKITGIVLGGARAKTPIDAAFEREQAGDWKLIEGE
jgi:tubulin monoglycylase TTLL15